MPSPWPRTMSTDRARARFDQHGPACGMRQWRAMRGAIGMDGTTAVQREQAEVDAAVRSALPRAFEAVDKQFVLHRDGKEVRIVPAVAHCHPLWLLDADVPLRRSCLHRPFVKFIYFKKLQISLDELVLRIQRHDRTADGPEEFVHEGIFEPMELGSPAPPATWKRGVSAVVLAHWMRAHLASRSMLSAADYIRGLCSSEKQSHNLEKKLWIATRLGARYPTRSLATPLRPCLALGSGILAAATDSPRPSPFVVPSRLRLAWHRYGQGRHGPSPLLHFLRTVGWVARLSSSRVAWR